MAQDQQQQGEGVPCKIDFLEFTVPAVRLFDVLDLVKVGGVVSLDSGWRGYSNSALVAGGLGRLGWHDDQEKADRMGVHVSLGGQALAFLAGADDRWSDLALILQLVRGDLGGKISRLDVAFDDVSADAAGGVLDLDVMEEALKSGAYSSRWRGGDLGGGWGNKAGKRVLYFGAGGSDSSCRAYDKRIERKMRGHGDQVDGVGHWVRVELQLRHERADAAAAVFAKSDREWGKVGRFFAGVLRGYMDFKVPNGSDSNKRRWLTAPWWSLFLGGVSKARLWVEKVIRTVDSVKAWVDRAVGPSLALVEQFMGKQGALEFLSDVVDRGRGRMGPRHRAILAAST